MFGSGCVSRMLIGGILFIPKPKLSSFIKKCSVRCKIAIEDNNLTSDFNFPGC
jgi:hypothetical protein